MTYTKENYSRIYSYGASASFGNTSKEIDKNNLYRFAKLESFIDANPIVVPVANYNSLCCQKHLRDGGKWGCDYSSCKSRYGSAHSVTKRGANINIWDHAHPMRMKDVKKSYFVASHPYWTHPMTTEQVTFYEKCLLSGLVAWQFKTDSSWYYPGATCLFLIGRGDVLDMLNLECLGNKIAAVQGAC